MQNKIKIQDCEIRQNGRYYLVTTAKGNRLGDWRGEEPLVVGKEYVIEWEHGGADLQYKNIKFAGPAEEALRSLEEI